jgi:hypothetical protein
MMTEDAVAPIAPPPAPATAADVADLKAAVANLEAAITGTVTRRMGAGVKSVVSKMASAVPTGKVAWTVYGASGGIVTATMVLAHAAPVVAAVAAFF